MPIVVAPPLYWLGDKRFTTMRLSLHLINTRPNFHNSKYENQCREFKGVVRDLVKVQLGFTKLEVPFPYLIHERPECNGQVITAFDGTHKGSQFRIKRFNEEVCSCLHLKQTALLRKIAGLQLNSAWLLASADSELESWQHYCGVIYDLQ